MISAADLGAVDDRGYRDAQLAAGLVEARPHLAAYALGAGASGMTFLDSEIPGLLGTTDAATLSTCVGVPEYRSRAAAGRPGEPVTVRTVTPRQPLSDTGRPARPGPARTYRVAHVATEMVRMRTRSAVLAVVLVGATATAAVPAEATAATDGGRLRLVSVSSQGTRGDDSAGQARMSADGRYVVFGSGATNLVPGDRGHDRDIFLRDRWRGRTTRITLSRDGAEADGNSSSPTITPDGRYIAYLSDASNLVPGDTNGEDDVFVLDRRTGRTGRVSVSTAGAQADFRSVLRPAISADGRYVAFLSWATNLVAGDTNDDIDVFVRDRRTRTTTRESVSPTGAQADGQSGWEPALSADGRFLAFSSGATNLVPGDTNGMGDVFLRDRRTGRTSRVSVSTAGAQARGDSFQTTMTADGRYVAFTSAAANLAAGDTNRVNDVFVRDRWAGTTTPVSVSSTGGRGNGHSADPAFGADGRYLVFASAATDLVPGADRNMVYDVFLRDLRTGLTRRVSVRGDGVEANDESFEAVVSPNGRRVLFSSTATNLVPGDPRVNEDVYLWSRQEPGTGNATGLA